jgi:ATP adenylyltransferase
MDHLWSPWRLAYITAAGEERGGCVFCRALTDPDAAPLVLFRGRAAYVVLNLYPYNNGHLMIVPNRHIGQLAAATRDELGEMIELTQRAERAITEAYAPHGMNVGLNLGKSAGAGILDHLHIHIVPRWSGDTNFMTVVGGARVLPEELPQTGERLRPIFERLARG